MEQIKTKSNVTNNKDNFKLIEKGKKLDPISVELEAIKKFGKKEYRSILAAKLQTSLQTISNAFSNKAPLKLYEIKQLLKIN